MDKSRKLRRYGRKDYSQVVEFPVEIVGRDGVVRRYSFEESIRLYQRRIVSAPSRYDDGDIADAEAEHCRQRIAQLRRSYFERYGGAALHRLELPPEGRPGLAGEVTALLRRCLGQEVVGPELQLDQVGALETASVWALRLDGETGALLLYAYPFEEVGEPGGPCPARDAFFAQVKLMQHLRDGGDGVESLVAFHHSADVGLVLTASAVQARGLRATASDEEADDDVEAASPTRPQRNALQRLHEGDTEGALEAFIAAYEGDHYRRSAYVGAAVVADQLGRFAEARLATEMGSRYFPDDPSLAWQLAVSRLREGDLPGATAALARASSCEADPHSVSVLRAIVALRQGALNAGRSHLLAAASADRGRDDALTRVRRRLRLAVASVSVARTVAVATGLAGLLSAATLPVLAAAAGLASVGLWLVAPRALQRWLAAVLARPGRDGFALASVATLSAAGARMRDAQ